MCVVLLLHSEFLLDHVDDAYFFITDGDFVQGRN